MEALTGVAQNPAAVEYVQRQNTEQQGGGNKNQSGGAAAVTDTTTISPQGLQLSQAVQQAQQTAGANENGEGPESRPDSEVGENVPRFLDIKA